MTPGVFSGESGSPAASGSPGMTIGGVRVRIIRFGPGPGLGQGWSECMRGSRVRVRKIGYGSVRAL